MSVIEKLDSVLELAAPLSSKSSPTDVMRASAKALDLLRDHGPAIRQDMIDARRYRWLKGKLNDKERGEWDFTIDLQTANTNKDSE